MYDPDNDNSPNDADADDPLAALTPDQLRQLLGLSVMPEKQDQLRQQLMQAHALRNAGGEPHSSPTGALLGALAQGINGAMGGYQEGDINRQMNDLQGQQVDARALLAQLALTPRRPRQPQPSPAGAGDILPSNVFGLG